MDSLDSFRQLFEYDYWASQESLRSMMALDAPPARALKVAGHILGAQRIWLGRLETRGGEPPAPWPLMSLKEAGAAFNEMHERWKSLLDNLAPDRLDEDLVHRNSKGVESRVPVRDVLMQLVTHGAYHRGQIAAMVREAGGTPAPTDYIVWARKQGPK
ncbi:MAG TPA: DinB family protein [Terriglobia bacterium]|nr:DinB family protein [Terriglobia bacterium]